MRKHTTLPRAVWFLDPHGPRGDDVDVDIWDSGTEGRWDPDTYDDDEPEVGMVHERSISKELMQPGEGEDTPSGWFDDTMRAKFTTARINAVWPPYNGAGAQYVLRQWHPLTDPLTIYTTPTLFPGLSSNNPYVNPSRNPLGLGLPPKRYEPKWYPKPPPQYPLRLVPVHTHTPLHATRGAAPPLLSESYALDVEHPLQAQHLRALPRTARGAAMSTASTKP
ncbi:hypothetical protein DXG01_015590 [Tephrocybe rancida]|nr:hypothetical protein DXG01_015590 [Tephrocybe rancida]